MRYHRPTLYKKYGTIILVIIKAPILLMLGRVCDLDFLFCFVVWMGIRGTFLGLRVEGRYGVQEFLVTPNPKFRVWGLGFTVLGFKV